MPALSFKVKLLLAMMGVVAGVTGATLYTTQAGFQREIQILFGNLFDAQKDAFLDKQNSLIEEIKQRSKSLLGARVQLAFESGNSERFYLAAKSELESIGIEHTFFLFLNAKGEIIPPPDTLTNLVALTRQERFQRQLGLAGKLVVKAAEPIVSFVTPETSNGVAELQQAICTKIVDEDGDALGALAIGSQLAEVKSSQMDSRSGFLFEDRLFASSIPASLHATLVQRLKDSIQAASPAGEDLRLEIEGEQHRVFYEPLDPYGELPKAYVIGTFSIQSALERQKALRTRIFLLGGAGLCGALLLSLLLSHGLSVPILALVRGTTEIQKGNYDVRVSTRSRDEIGRLAESFNQMAVGLAEKEKFRSILNMVSDKEVAEELIAGNLKLGGERREISVLFCDIRGFTPLTQGMDPDEVIRMLNEHFTPLARVVSEHHGVVDKFVGDLIMAVFGAPKRYGDDAFNAAACARAMIRERAKLNAVSKYHIDVGIGVASGPALAGCMGSEDRLNYTVLGERVNLASRLCSKAGRMDVVIDQTTHDLLQTRIPTSPLGEIELKGFSSRVQAYKLLEVLPKAEVV